MVRILRKEALSMKSRERIETIIKEHPENALIFASRIYQEKLSNEMNEAAYYQMLSRMCKDGSMFFATLKCRKLQNKNVGF